MIPPTGLPIEDCLDDLRAALRSHHGAVLQAPPGAGKTTLVPLALLDDYAGKILVLEPRRLATRAAARRMASLRGESVGGVVGYRTRDDSKTSKATRVEVVTEGILTRRIQNDPSLNGIDVVVFDEFHERSMHADLGLALTLDAQRGLRPDLKILVMSATLDGAPIAKLIGTDEPVPVISSDGRMHPVEVRWMPVDKKTRIAEATANAVRTAVFEESGDVLVFLPGVGEIRQVERQLGESPLISTEPVSIRPLYGALNTADQDAAIEPSPLGERKVVLATDIAETSLTIEGIRVVVDSGLARKPRFDTRTGLTRLDTTAISRASAEQRSGRAGRLEPGVSYRLWSKVEHATRAAFTPSELAGADLAPLMLEVLSWGVSDPSKLPFLDPPRPKDVETAAALLHGLGAIDDDRYVTDHGKALVNLPLHPRLAHMVVESADEGHGALACIIAALLEDRDILRGRADEVEVDIGIRIRLVNGGGSHHPQLDRRALQRTRTQAEDLMRRMKVASGSIDETAAGRVLARAYPDRIGRSRQPGNGTYKLVSGSGAWVDKSDPLARSEYIVAADLDGRGANKRIRLAAGLDETELDLLFAAQIESSRQIKWDKTRDDVVQIETRRLGRLSLNEHRDRPPHGDQVITVLTNQVQRTKLRILPWTDGARALQDRAGFVRDAVGEPWPDLSDEALTRSVSQWLSPYLGAARSRADLDVLDLTGILLDRFSWQQRKEFDQLAPTHIEAPTGSRIRLDYSKPVPAMAVKLQEMFGVTDTPRIADGRVAVVVELLSPAGRPLQVTQDLAGFWTSSYQQVRSEMRGRYPKHPWPEDPTIAKPTRGTKHRR